MTTASLLIALIATLAAPEGSGEPVLLDFTATWCGPCQSMRPELEKLARKGYPIRAVDIDRQPELAERHGVKAVPTFVVVDARGRALARTSGAMPAAQLASFYNETLKGLPASDAKATETQATTADDTTTRDDPESADPAPASVNPKPWETVVRIKMHLSSSEWGYGSGTIIHSTPEESIILTCAHIFRVKDRQQPSPRNFRVPIAIDLFDGQLTGRQPAMVHCVEKDIPGEAIDYDFTNDVGLIRIRPGRKLPASRVVPAHWKPRRGMNMFAVGCSHGQDATAWDTRILDPRVGMSNTGTKQSFASMKCEHQPKEGRSGGGLYTTDGYVAGVCDFADPNERTGLYAVPDAIHRLLDKNELTALYGPPKDRGGAMLAANPARPRATGNAKYRGQSINEADLQAARPASAGSGPITLPPPDLVGIAPPRPAADGAKSWQSNAAPSRLAAADRSPRRPTPAEGQAIDPGAPVGVAVPTDLGMEPEEGITPEPPTPARPASNNAARAGGWKPARRALPDLSTANPSR